MTLPGLLETWTNAILLLSSVLRKAPAKASHIELSLIKSFFIPFFTESTAQNLFSLSEHLIHPLGLSSHIHPHHIHSPTPEQPGGPTPTVHLTSGKKKKKVHSEVVFKLFRHKHLQAQRHLLLYSHSIFESYLTLFSSSF